MTRYTRRYTVLLIGVLLALVVLAGGAAAEPTATSASFIPGEPNDTFATATPFSVNRAEKGYFLTAGDLDYYRAELPVASDLYINVRPAGDRLNPAPQVTLYDGSHHVLAENTDCNDEVDLSLPADAGTYFLLLRPCPGPLNIDSPYSLDIYWNEDTNHPSPGDVEPNDTPAQAVPAHYGDMFFGGTGDGDPVDYYRFEGQAGDQIAIAPTENGYSGHPDIVLYDPALNPVALNSDWPVLWVMLPATGTYRLSFDAYNYDRMLILTDGDEPNNTPATAIPVVAGQRVSSVWDYPCDPDWYVFQGRAGDVFTELGNSARMKNIYLYDANGAQIYDTNVLPADGLYYLLIDGYEFNEFDDSYCLYGPYAETVGQALWVSAAVDGLGGNAAIKRGDIATRKTAAGQWQIVFDASDVGITQNVAAFEPLPNGSILLSLAAGQAVPGLGKVMPQDIIRFVPAALGDNTAGTFQWFLDGSDVGLTTSGEKIDAISMQRDVENPLRISLSGAGSVPRQSGGALKVADEDVITFVGTSYGENSAGAWRVYLDGSTVPGMAAEDVTAMTRVELFPARTSQTLFGFDSAFTINGHKGTTFDVVFEGSWLPAVQRLTDKKIDGLGVGPAWTP